MFRDSTEEKRKLEEEQKRNKAKQKQRTRKLQRLITSRAEANDPHLSLSQIYKSKLKLFRYSVIYPSKPWPSTIYTRLLVL